MTLKIKANAGGVLDPKDTIGRTEFIKQLWEVLIHQSVILTSERRIGKSSVIRKMEDEPNERWTIVMRDVEGISSVKEFVTRLIDDLYEYQTNKNKTMKWLTSIRKELDGWSFFGIKVGAKSDPDWIEVLERLLENLCAELEQRKESLLLIWDEFPWMLQKIIKSESAHNAANLLDNLRHARQKNSNIRMVYTGSIGLHHVLNVLRAEGISNEPTNDMAIINLPAFTPENAKDLTEALVAGEDLKVVDDAVYLQLPECVDHVPYYIHHIIRTLKNKRQVITVESVETCIKESFVDANDPWDLRHYQSRLEEYYGEQYFIYQSILDIIAHSQAGLGEQDIFAQLQAVPYIAENYLSVINAPNFINKALILLAADHYLLKDPEHHTYDFSYPLIKTWWMRK